MAASWDSASWGENNWWEEGNNKASEDAAAPAAEASGDQNWQQSSWEPSAAQEAWGSTDAAAPPPAAEPQDPWAASANGWGTEKTDADATWEDKPPPATDFWESQKWNKEQGTLTKKEDWQLEQDDELLFQQRLGTNAGIDFQRYENVPVEISGEKANMIPVCKTFDSLYETFQQLIPGALMDNVRRCRYETPTPVQKYAIPGGLAGRDIMCCAQTGSGKTAAFLIPAIGRMLPTGAGVYERTAVYEGACAPSTLVITPTRELCIQIHEEAMKFTHRTKFRSARVYGGEKPAVQLREISGGADLLVATPGRLNDFINRGCIKVDAVNILVLDEADRMLDMGFEPQIREIVEKHGMPSKEARQTMMFSATFPADCQKLASDYLYNYIWIGVGVVGSAVDTVEQKLVRVEPKSKFDQLIEELDNFYETKEKGHRCLVFVNAKDTARFLDEQLYSKSFQSGALHGDLDQHDREKNLTKFRSGDIDVLIATDVASRGIDVEDVKLVINYDMPTEINSYVHRIGRTGRIGNTGTAITFIAVDNDQDGNTLEHTETLKKLVDCMRNSGSTLPDWLEGLVDKAEAAQSSSWKWGGKDYRSGQESYQANGSGDWGNWKGTEQSWEEKKEDSWGNGW